MIVEGLAVGWICCTQSTVLAVQSCMVNISSAIYHTQHLCMTVELGINWIGNLKFNVVRVHYQYIWSDLYIPGVRLTALRKTPFLGAMTKPISICSGTCTYTLCVYVTKQQITSSSAQTTTCSICDRTIAYFSVRSCHKCIPLKQLNEGYLYLQQTESHSNANAWTKAKWTVTKLRSLSSFLGCESTRHCATFQEAC